MNDPRTVKVGRKPKGMSPDTWTEPDLVDRVWDYLLRSLPELAPREAAIKAELRSEFGGLQTYVRVRDARPPDVSEAVGRLYNGRNASEVARVLGISRASVYRHVKQAGRRGG